eukprot:m51a1_g8543 hypothetical protein (198) ;mRNA; f:54366-54959
MTETTAYSWCMTQPGRPDYNYVRPKRWAEWPIKWRFLDETVNCTEFEVMEAVKAWNEALDHPFLAEESSLPREDYCFTDCDAPPAEQRMNPNALAESFLGPHDKAHSNLWVYPRLRLKPNAVVGVLMHELGHVLGYRHEHVTNPPALMHGEDPAERFSNWNSDSVMFYLHILDCWEKNRTIEFSRMDRIAIFVQYRQ